jgi:hypothetical protein
MNAIQPVSNLKTGLGVQENKLSINTNRGSKPARHDDQSDGSSERSLLNPTQVAKLAAETEEIFSGYYPNMDHSIIRSLVVRNINDLERHYRGQPHASDPNSSIGTSSVFMSKQGNGIH